MDIQAGQIVCRLEFVLYHKRTHRETKRWTYKQTDRQTGNATKFLKIRQEPKLKIPAYRTIPISK